ncbi:uncharacterized protein LOC109820907 [Asparagus officinalis]|uniref:uncharacterized protein LOC109820907 n=1 Tax=Asparagus officinalis TaxID=4686 RepID=UPI00098E5945|nr:uncharacterized protein LOC109820907 [Asparagus officinalis]
MSSMSHNNEIAALLMEEEADEEYAMFLGMTAVEEERVANERSASRRLGSVRGHAVIQCDRVQGHNRLYRDYFAEEPVFGSQLFRRRFQMHLPLFLRIASAVEDFDPYFVQRRNVADFVDDYVRIGESTTIESVKKFVKVIVVIFTDEYLRSPNNDDIRRLLEIGELRGFPGMLGNIDCMHWRWKNYPAAWHGMYDGHIHEPIIILEVVASYDLWIWHAFFELPGSYNDINVLKRSNLFIKLTKGRAPPVNYSINSHEYMMGYYLADGIYRQWSTFVKIISVSQVNKRKILHKLKNLQEMM